MGPRMETYNCNLDNQTIEKTVKKIIADHLGLIISELHLEDDLVRDLGADDLDQKELIMTVEERFNIRIAETEFDCIKSVKDIIEVVQNRCNAGKKAREN